MVKRISGSFPSVKTPAPEYLPASSRKFIHFVRRHDGLERLFSSGRSLRAAYMVIDHQFYFSEQGHIITIRQVGEDFIEKHKPSHFGWFKVMPHPAGRGKNLIIFDSFSDYNRGRSPDQRWDRLSIDEYFTFFYVLLLKSGIDKFSIRMTSCDKRAAGVNENNWKTCSDLLFENERAEENFITQLRQAILTASGLWNASTL